MSYASRYCGGSPYKRERRIRSVTNIFRRDCVYHVCVGVARLYPVIRATDLQKSAHGVFLFPLTRAGCLEKFAPEVICERLVYER